MELKHEIERLLLRIYQSINRTFMELKHEIERLLLRIYQSINRTFMELKLRTSCLV